MVTKEHEAPIDLFARFPNVLAQVLRELDVGIQVPDEIDIELVSERCTENTPGELVADEVPLLKLDGKSIAAIVFEVQRKNVISKLGAWVRYVASVWDRHRVPTVLLVYCEDLAQARKASEPIHIGPGNVITPMVVSPASLPPINDLSVYADRVDLAVFAALLHAGDPDTKQTLVNLCHLLQTIEAEQAAKYAKCLIEILPERARKILEDLMATATYPYQDAFARMEERGLARGQALGEAKILLRVLSAQGFEVSDDIRERVLSCPDTSQIEAWVDRLPNAKTIDDVFADTQ